MAASTSPPTGNVSIIGVLPQTEWQSPSRTKYCQYQDCGAKFGLFSSKTNCRRCGIVLCSKCACNFSCISGHYDDKPQIVCLTCLEHIERQKMMMNRAAAMKTEWSPQQRQDKNDNVSAPSGIQHDREIRPLEKEKCVYQQTEEEPEQTKDVFLKTSEEIEKRGNKRNVNPNNVEEIHNKITTEIGEKIVSSNPNEKERQNTVNLIKKDIHTETLHHNDKHAGKDDVTRIIGSSSNEKKRTLQEKPATTKALIDELFRESDELQEQVRESREEQARLGAQLQQSNDGRDSLCDQLRADADALRARVVELGRERDELQEQVRDSCKNGGGTKNNVCYSSVDGLDCRPLELLAANSVPDGCSVLSVKCGSPDLSIDVREKKLMDRMALVRLREKKLLAVARKLRAKNDELNELELKLVLSVKSCEAKVKDGSCCSVAVRDASTSPLCLTDVTTEISPHSTFDSTQLELLCATEAYRDLFYQNILEDAVTAEVGGATGIQYPVGETALERTLQMSQEVECLLGDNGNSTSVGPCDVNGSPFSDEEKKLRERKIQAFRRLEKAMEALS
ncbi:hypothetical protein MOQ_003305 [Trypanosoma cruzi marinkellei]|uniref:FYVE-type domain-containing protein n=1 Tax=Trypanosoma cruzi marinkellei TaxID=85056 RepID=K2NV26_TRYCR|nr:hypothetical protein MOQ_003305 [Trypanosoma cruzi marinkellei]